MVDRYHGFGLRHRQHDETTTPIAARYKALGGSYADCLAAALAKHHKAILLIGDYEFQQIEKENLIVWL